MRRFDVDAYTLSDRLRQILDPSGSNVSVNGRLLQQILTTDSFDVASPCVLATTEIRNQVASQNSNNYVMTTNLSIVDMLRYRLIYGNGTQAGLGTGATAAQINMQLLKMLPAEIMAGQYMDINRPFGNGRDDNANSVVDEPQEYITNNALSPSEAAWNGVYPAEAATPFDLINGMDFNSNGPNSLTDAYQSFTKAPVSNFPSPNNGPQVYARQLYARHLYVLMMLLIDQGYVAAPTAANSWANQPVWGGIAETTITNTLPSGSTEQTELTARRVAQWAVNVADYRDADSIMTPFEYDVNPFNGWQVDGIVDTVEDTSNPPTDSNSLNIKTSTNERRVVWGCEYPELIITETFNTHDRRVRDTKNDNGPNKQRFSTTPLQETDTTLDQIRIPQGSTFVELYCPRGNSIGSANSSTSSHPANYGGSQAVFPGDLYTYNSANNQWYLNLGQMSPDQVNPVWRLAITASNIKNQSNNVAARMTAYPATTTLDPPGDPYSCSVFNTTNNYNPGGYSNATIERIAWFTNVQPTNNNAANARIYFNQGITTQTVANAAASPQVLLAPGSYAVVGPRPATTFGAARRIIRARPPILLLRCRPRRSCSARPVITPPTRRTTPTSKRVPPLRPPWNTSPRRVRICPTRRSAPISSSRWRSFAPAICHSSPARPGPVHKGADKHARRWPAMASD